MDFIDWCGSVLQTLIEAGQTSSQVRSIGAHEGLLAKVLFGKDFLRSSEYARSSQRNSLILALEELCKVELVENVDVGGFWRVTPAGREFARGDISRWTQICRTSLESDQEQLLRLVNQLSPRADPDHIWLEPVKHEAIVPELGWPDGRNLGWAVGSELERLELVEFQGFLAGNFELRATYRGLVWETRRGLALESKLIDDLVREWETTSVDFKREVHTATASEKAELIKDVLGLANTQASGRRWLIIGFDDKTHQYYGPPDPKLTQNHFEHLMARYTKPVVGVRYEVVDYRAGRVGKLEVLRDRTKLSYSVAESVGDRAVDKKRVEQGQIFVRHGSQTEQPTPDELQAIQDEGDRARANG